APAPPPRAADRITLAGMMGGGEAAVEDARREASGRGPVRRSALNGLDIRTWMRFTRSWFVCNPPPRRREQLQHPAKFPEAMARPAIEFFTAAGETVLDPFAGVGSALSAAAAAGRRGVGIELSPEFHALAAGRPDLGPGCLALLGDARNAPALLEAAGVAEVHYVLTSPPYWNMLRLGRGNADSVQRRRERAGLRTAYSSAPEDLGNIAEYDAFVAELAGVLGALKSVLAPGRYLTVVTQNVRVPGGEVRPLAWDLARALSEHYTFKGERIWVQENKPLGPWGWPSEFVTNVHHHYCLNFKNDRRGAGGSPQISPIGE
ncbi:MAG TPA: DNA methyltransferase, partial [Armatimonadota bacterium]|nr:DNA methyltransferase [Armatimonadota bacterium]